MNWSPVLLCGWPGLPGLWYRGYMSSLLVAVGFAILLNLALISSFIWPWSLGETFPMFAWPTIIFLWATSAFTTYRRLPDLMSVGKSTISDAPQPSDTLFIQAQREYLGGHWEEAETILRRSINHAPRDIEARLLLSTMLRHARRLDEANHELSSILKLDESVNWIFEIQREQQLIELITDYESSDELGEDDVIPPNNDGYIKA